jgi:hypothetical protein
LDFRSFLRQESLLPGARFVLHGSIAVTLAILAEGLFDYNLGDSKVLTMFLVVIACGYIAGGCTIKTAAADEYTHGWELAPPVS